MENSVHEKWFFFVIISVNERLRVLDLVNNIHQTNKINEVLNAKYK